MEGIIKKMKEIKKEIKEYEQEKYELAKERMLLKEQTNFKETIQYKENQKRDSFFAAKINNLNKELKLLEKQHAIETLEKEYKEMFENVLRIKTGKYKGQLKKLHSFGRIYRKSGSGRFTNIIKDIETQKVIDMLKELKIEISFGNDAPRGGKMGEFYQVNEDTKIWEQYKKFQIAVD